MQYRKVMSLTKKQQERLRSCFDFFGAKADFERATGISRRTVARILKNGQGQENIVNAMIEYCQKQ